MSIKLNTAREVVRDIALQSAESSYSDTRVDYAIKAAMNKFLRETRADTETSTATLIASQATFDLSSADSQFQAWMWIDGYIDEDPVLRRSWRYVQRRSADSSSEGQPEYIAFQSNTVAKFYPIPSSDYADLTFRWWRPLTNFDVGTASNPDLNLDETWAYEALTTGPPAILLQSDPAEGAQPRLWANFERLIFRVRGLDDPDNAIDVPNMEDLL